MDGDGLSQGGRSRSSSSRSSGSSRGGRSDSEDDEIKKRFGAGSPGRGPNAPPGSSSSSSSAAAGNLDGMGAALDALGGIDMDLDGDDVDGDALDGDAIDGAAVAPEPQKTQAQIEAEERYASMRAKMASQQGAYGDEM